MERTRPIAKPQRWWAIAAMGVGLVLTIVATIVPFLTSDLRDHIDRRDGQALGHVGGDRDVRGRHERGLIKDTSGDSLMGA
jgi:hypothetical protein